MTRRFQETIRDELLVLQSQQGEPEAFAKLVEKWQEPLFSYAMRLTCDREVAMEVVQDTWLAVIRGIVRLKDITRFQVWLYRVLTNKYNDRLRDAVRSRKLAKGIAERAQERGADRQDERGSVWGVVEKLPPDSRAVLTLMYVDDFSIREIAEVLGVPEGTVKSRLYHSREAVRKAIERA